MASVYCPLDTIWNPLKISSRIYLWGIILIKLVDMGRHAHCGWHHSLARILDGIYRGRNGTSTGISCFLLLHRGCHMGSSCCHDLPHQDELWHWAVEEGQTFLPLVALLRVFCSSSRRRWDKCEALYMTGVIKCCALWCVAYYHDHHVKSLVPTLTPPTSEHLHIAPSILSSVT